MTLWVTVVMTVNENDMVVDIIDVNLNINDKEEVEAKR